MFSGADFYDNLKNLPNDEETDWIVLVAENLGQFS